MMNNYKQRAARLALFACVLSPVGAVQADQTCTVRDCHDGDTCTLICAGEKTKVRLHCIDAPEMKQAPWGENSRDVLRNRLPAGSTVELQSTTRDRYGRTVGVLLLDGVNINLHLVQSGWAVAYPKYCAEPVYYQAQKDAEANRRGVWKQDGEQRQPWEWRAAKR